MFIRSKYIDNLINNSPPEQSKYVEEIIKLHKYVKRKPFWLEDKEEFEELKLNHIFEFLLLCKEQSNERYELELDFLQHERIGYFNPKIKNLVKLRNAGWIK